jgi:two-component sensor histidine kinase
MQGALNSAVIRISRSSDPAEFDQVKKEVVIEVKQMLTAIDQADADETDLAVVIERITDTWQDICKINWQINNGLVNRVSNTPAAFAIADVLVEAVFNAIKHASPEKMNISLGYNTDNAIELRVTHAGSLVNSGNSGLGTKIYDNLTMSHSLNQSNGEVTFKATFLSS